MGLCDLAAETFCLIIMSKYPSYREENLTSEGKQEG